MSELGKNISTRIVENKTGDILKRLAPELGISLSKTIEMTPNIINGLLQYKSINQIAVIKVAEVVAPQLPMLGEKLYDGLKLCSEEERAKIIKMVVVSIPLTILGTCGTGVIKDFKIQNEKTKRVEAVCDLINNFSLAEIIRSIGDVIGRKK